MGPGRKGHIEGEKGGSWEKRAGRGREGRVEGTDDAMFHSHEVELVSNIPGSQVSPLPLGFLPG